MKEIIEILTEKFIEVIDSDITHLEMVANGLDQLRAAVIKREEEQLKQILTIVQSAISAYANVEMQSEVIRFELSKCLRCDLSEMNISKLREFVSLEQSEKLLEKQGILRGLIEKIKREHISTVMFLQECTRLNDKMLLEILGNNKQLTYNSNGKSRWNATAASTSMVNLKL